MGRVFVLGHRGMLGHVVARVFEAAGYQVCTSASRFDGALSGGLLDEVRRADCPIVVNCIGTTAGRADAASLWLTNALLPQALVAAASPGALLIHSSTDGVFSGRRGRYRADEAPDAQDAYGVSKRLGELCSGLGSVVVLRASIGPEQLAARSLLSWYLAESAPVRGFSDQWWNGVTSLAWAECALRAARGELAPGLHQPACETPLTKAGLLGAIRVAFGRGAEIVEVASGSPCDRTLEPTLRLAPIQQQLAELRAWYAK